MKPFAFRAQAALDIRRTAEDAARRELAVAESRLREAEQLVDEAERAIDAAHARTRNDMAAALNAGVFVWHRNWMVGLQRDAARARQTREERRMDVKTAAARAQQAHRAVRTLERLRDREMRAYTQRARREEQTALDLLGSLQYAARQIARGEQS